MSSDPRPLADMPSRVIAILSLIVALATLAIVMTRSGPQQPDKAVLAPLQEQLKKESEQHAASVAELDRQYQAALDSQQQKIDAWNATLNDAVAAFKADATMLLTKIEDDSQALNQQQRVAFRQQIQELLRNAVRDNNAAAPLANLTPPTNASVDRSDSDASTAASDATAANQTAADRTAADDPADQIPTYPNTRSVAVSSDGSLRVLQSVLRPSDENATPAILIENTSTESVSLNRIRFQPQRHFSARQQPSTAADSATAGNGTVVVTFRPEHNRSRSPEKHGVYSVTLEQPLVIEAGDRMQLQLRIADNKYAGWGFVGKLAVDNGLQTQLSVDDARVLFQ